MFFCFFILLLKALNQCMQFDFFALSTTLIDTAKLQLPPISLYPFVPFCTFLYLFVTFCDFLCRFWDIIQRSFASREYGLRSGGSRWGCARQLDGRLPLVDLWSSSLRSVSVASAAAGFCLSSASEKLLFIQTK